jgi:hypothetical protein
VHPRLTKPVLQQWIRFLSPERLAIDVEHNKACGGAWLVEPSSQCVVVQQRALQKAAKPGGSVSGALGKARCEPRVLLCVLLTELVCCIVHPHAGRAQQAACGSVSVQTA